MAEQADAGQTPDFGTVAEEREQATPEAPEKGGVKVKPNPLLGRFASVVASDGKLYTGGEKISKEQFNKLQKDSVHRPTLDQPEGFPLLVEDN